MGGEGARAPRGDGALLMEERVSDRMLVIRSGAMVAGGAIVVEESMVGTSEMRFMPPLGGIGTPNTGMAEFDGSAKPKPATTIAADGAKVMPGSPAVSAVL